MSDHVPSYARHDAGRSPPPRARPAPRGARRDDDRGHDRSGDRSGDRSPRGVEDRRDRDRRLGGGRPDDDAPWEYGVVVTLRDAFGFVKGFKRGSGPQLFFHASEVRGSGIASLRAGDEVKFVAREPAPGARPGDRDGKANALDVTALTEGDRAPIVLAKGACGTVARALRGRTKADAYGGRVAVAATEMAADEKKPSDEGTATTTHEFSGKDLAESCPRLREGDVVSFDLVEHKFTGERRLADIAFVRHAERKPGSAAAAKEGVTDPADEPASVPRDAPAGSALEGREAGRVEKLTPSYGFIRKIGGRLDDETRTRGSPNPSLFFHYTQLARDTRERDLNLGCAVTFSRGEDGRSGKPTAVDVSLAPEEEARALEAREKAHLAKARAAAAPATGSDADRWGKEKKAGAATASNASLDPPDGDPSTNDPSLELGVVSVMKANYGFIKCCARSDDLFFHFTEVLGGEAAVAVGRDVAFKTERRQAPGQRRGEDKPVAVAVRAAPKGSAVFETVEETPRQGVCVERLVFGRAGGYGAPGELEFVFAPRDGEDAALFEGSGVSSNASNRGPHQDTPEARDGETTRDETADVAASGSVPSPKEDDAKAEGGARVRLTFSRAGLADPKSNPRPGDAVRFRVRTDSRTKRKTATGVEPVRFAGVVVAVKQQGSYGFLEHDDPEAGPEGAGEAGEGDDAGAASDGGGDDDADGAIGDAGRSAEAPTDSKPELEEEKQAPEPPAKAAPEKAKGKGEKWQYESEIAADAAKAAAKRARKHPRRTAAGKMRVFFHGSDVEGGAVLREGDEVEYCVTLPVQLRGRRGDGPGGGGKDPQARRIVRTKEAPAPTRPTFVNEKKSADADFGGEPTGERPAGTQFAPGRVFAQASMPDGTRGFSMGRGKGLAEAARAAISKLKLDAAPFAAPGSGPGSRAGSPAPEPRLAAEATEDA